MLAKGPGTEMMEAHAPARILPPAPLHAGRRALALLASCSLTALSLAGCNGGLQPPTPLHIALGTNSDQRLDSELREDFQERLGLLERGFLRLHPHAVLQVALYPGDQLIAAMQRRSRAGLEPDLIFVNGDTAVKLLNAGVVDPYPASPELLRSFDPTLLDRVRDPQGRLAGVPLLVQTQLSCFNRQQIPEAPRSLDELLQLSASGVAIGLSVEPIQLTWTAGSLGAIPAVIQAVHGGEGFTAAHREALVRWLDWLKLASGQQRVVFFSSQQEATAEFLAQRVAWIPCSSLSIDLLRRQLGANLGVAPLPDGPNQQQAAALNRVRVIALGRHSSAQARRLALDFVRFSANPLTQRSMTIGSLTVLPANRFVSLPLQSSQQLQAMQIAAEQGKQTNPLAGLMLSDDSRFPQMQTLLTRLVFGEATPAATADALLRILERRP
jgi:arabinogalactan oligomer/maltooligosaccharide transport system substrate-binding protein